MLMAVMVGMDPAADATAQEKNSTIMVRSAVAISESVSFIPHFASMAVIPAKNEENSAAVIHIDSHPLHRSSVSSMVSYINKLYKRIGMAAMGDFGILY